MRKNIALLCIDSNGIMGALAKVVDVDQIGNRSVMIIFPEMDDEHLTLHEQTDSPRLLFTHYSKQMQSKSGQVKVDVSIRLGYQKPERHAHYIVHQDLYNESIESPFYRMCIPFTYCRQPIPQKYSKIPKRITLAINSDNFILSIYFTRNEDDFDDNTLIPIKTSLGYLSFDVKSK